MRATSAHSEREKTLAKQDAHHKAQEVVQQHPHNECAHAYTARVVYLNLNFSPQMCKLLCVAIRTSCIIINECRLHEHISIYGIACIHFWSEMVCGLDARFSLTARVSVCVVWSACAKFKQHAIARTRPTMTMTTNGDTYARACSRRQRATIQKQLFGRKKHKMHTWRWRVVLVKMLCAYVA